MYRRGPGSGRHHGRHIGVIRIILAPPGACCGELLYAAPRILCRPDIQPLACFNQKVKGNAHNSTRIQPTLVAEVSDTVLIGSEQRQVFATLSPEEQMIADSLLKAAPGYRYELSGLPRLDPPPPPGPASAAAAAKAMMAWITSRRLH